MTSISLSPSRVSLPLLLLLACASTPPSTDTMPPEATPILELAPCPDDPQGECGRIEVWEDRQARAGRKISVFVKVFRATGANPAPDPLFLFAGGPGQAIAGVPAEGVHALREHRDVVLVDQRGTGRSHALTCPGWKRQTPAEMLEPYLDLADVVACRDHLSQIADLRHYTTDNYVDDVDDVRRALGYDKINVYGTSYGTRPVQVYVRRYPKHARTATMHGVVTMDDKYPLGSTFAGQIALDGIFDACQADPACVGVWGDPEAHLQALLPRFANGPISVLHGGETLSLRADVMMEGIRHVMYQSAGSVTVPRMLERAAVHGDYSYLLDAIFMFESMLSEGDDWSSGLWLSVSCSEDAPWISDDDLARVDAETRFGRYRGQRHADACKVWPTAELSPGFREPVVADVPTLILSGAYDPATSAANGDEVAEHLTQVRHVVAKDGHSFRDWACSDRVLNGFLAAGTTAGVDTSCLEQVTLPPWPTKPAPVDAAVVAQLAGPYVASQPSAVPPGFGTIELASRDGALRLLGEGGNPQLRLTAVADDRFTVEGAGAEMTVVRDDSGRTTALSMSAGGMLIEYKPAAINRGRDVLLTPASPNFSPAVRVGQTVFLSGNVGIDPATGKLVSGGVGPETEQALRRIEGTLQQIGLDLGDVAKCTVFLANMKDYEAMNEVYRTVWPAEPPARTTVQAKPPVDARVEIECIAATR